MSKRRRKKNQLEAKKSLGLEVKRKHWLSLADFWFAAANLQSERCRSAASSDQSRIIDLNFYVVACQRLRNLAKRMRSDYPESIPALATFDLRWPQLENLRDIQEHILVPNSDPERGLYGIAYFAEFVANLKPAGTVEYLIDTREHEKAVMILHGELVRILSEAKAVTKQALAADSPVNSL